MRLLYPRADLALFVVEEVQVLFELFSISGVCISIPPICNVSVAFFYHLGIPDTLIGIFLDLYIRCKGMNLETI